MDLLPEEDQDRQANQERQSGEATCKCVEDEQGKKRVVDSIDGVLDRVGDWDLIDIQVQRSSLDLVVEDFAKV